MRQPLWAINSSLLFFCILGQVVFLFLHTPIARRVSLEPDTVSLIQKKINETVDISKIYGPNDLFDTYVVSRASELKPIELAIPAIPEVPPLIPLVIPVEAPKVFIAPLPVVLKGVMFVHDRPSESVAIIQFQDSKEEINYRVGQLINDAQILKIYANRIIVVRSNGQQETLYLREDDAGKDLALDTAKELSALSIPVKNGVYQIPVEKFINYIKTLGQFIDILDLTTVYKKGKSIGCRVGKADKDSLGSKLGFVYDDIIQQIDDLPVTDIASRVLAFDHIVEKKTGDIITVKVERSGSVVSLQYALVASLDKKTTQIVPSAKLSAGSASPVNEPLMYNIEEQRKRTLEQKVKMAPTAHQFAVEEQRKIFEGRRREMLANRHDQATVGMMPRLDVHDVQKLNQQQPSHSFLGAKG